MLKNDVLRFIIAYKVDKLMCNLSKGIENRGKAIGLEEGALKTLVNLVNKGMLTKEEAAEECKLSVEEFLEKKEEYEKTNH